MWGDNLYMSLPFVIRWGAYKNDPAALDDAANQIINYAAHLQDKDGIWFHAYFVDKNMPACCKWGRANGWVAVAITEVLSVLPETHPKYNQVYEIYKNHVAGLKKYQAPDGLWNQVIDHRELNWGTETSCSACFTYAIARGINRGWLDSSYLPLVEKSLSALSDTTRVSTDGEILKVCASTSIGLDLHYYESRPIEARKEYSHGSGLMLFALSEMHTLLLNKGKLSK
jgi:unsaturated rhamnogalacturonyl hydrolase